MRNPSEIQIGEYTLAEILERHLHWLNEDVDGWEDMNADLRYANLSDANLSGANLRYANLRYAKEAPYIPFACPSDGSFVAWKKVNKKLIKLQIPANAKRCSATTNKCRASEAKVLGIYELNGSKTDLTHILNTSQMSDLDYVVGKVIYPDSFDDDRWNECSHGIYFFINKEDAIRY